MGEYSYDYMTGNFAVGLCDDRGPAWWHAEYEKLAFGGSIPLDVARKMIGWDPISVPMLYRDPDDAAIKPHGKGQIILRGDTLQPVGFNGGATNPLGFWEWFITGPGQILDTNTHDLVLGFVGVFKGGSLAAVQIEMAKSIVDNVTGMGVRPFIYGAASLDGSIKNHYGRGATRMVCDNTFRMGVSEAKASGLFYAVKQTKNRKLDVIAARTALDVMHSLTDDVTAELHALAEKDVSERQWAEFLDAYVPLPEKASADKPGRAYTLAANKRDELSTLWVSDARVAPWRGTALGVSQAVTTWDQHMSTVRNVSRLERQKLDMISGRTTGAEQTAMATLQNVLAAV